MSVSFLLDSNNNIVARENFFFCEGTDSLTQDLKTSLSMTARENPYNINQGVDYLRYMQASDRKGLLAAIESRVYEDRRVKRCSLSVRQDKNTLNIEIDTIENKKIELEV